MGHFYSQGQVLPVPPVPLTRQVKVILGHFKYRLSEVWLPALWTLQSSVHSGGVITNLSSSWSPHNTLPGPYLRSLSMRTTPKEF